MAMANNKKSFIPHILNTFFRDYNPRKCNVLKFVSLATIWLLFTKWVNLLKKPPSLSKPLQAQVCCLEVTIKEQPLTNIGITHGKPLIPKYRYLYFMVYRIIVICVIICNLFNINLYNQMSHVLSWSEIIFTRATQETFYFVRPLNDIACYC